MHKLKSLLLDENGTVMVIVAGAMVALMGFAACVVDVGMLYAGRARLMDTADAAALAGAQELPSSETDAETVARDYIARNGENVSDFSVDAVGDRLTVTANSDVDFFFAPVLGINTGDVGARAVATARAATTGKGVVPIGIDKEQPRIPGHEYELKMNAPPDDAINLGSGNFGALDLDGNNGGGGNDYRDRLRDGYEGVLKVGDIIIPESGNKVGPTEQGITPRLDGCTHSPKCIPDNYDPDCPRVVIIPVYEIYQIQGQKVKSMRIVGFSAFLIKEFSEDGNGQGNNSSATIEGYFLDDYVMSGDSNPSQTNFGVYAVKLIE